MLETAREVVDTTAELRGWITITLALLFGAGSLIGVSIAVRNYLHTTWQTKVAVARLVWAEERGPHFAPKAGAWQIPRPNAKALIQRPETRGRISTPNLFEAAEVDGVITVVWREDGRISYATLTNNSDEPVGNVTLVLNRGNRPRAAAQDRLDMPRTLLPKSSIVIEVNVPRDGGSAFSPGVFVLSFTDAAGLRWERRGTRPPVLVPKPQPKKFRKVQAWWFRTKRKFKKADRAKT